MSFSCAYAIIAIMKGAGSPERKTKMSYEELANHIKNDNCLKTRWGVVCWLMGYQGKIEPEDIDNIIEAYINYLID